MSPTDFKKLQEKFPIGPGVTKINCPEVNNRIKPDAQIAVKTSGRSTDEDKLNKLERAYLAYLRAMDYPWIGIQNVTLKLAHDCRLTVDFVVLDIEGRLAFFDVKGFQREDALIKMKIAARMFPFWMFQIVTRDKYGQWEHQVVKP